MRYDDESIVAMIFSGVYFRVECFYMHHWKIMDLTSFVIQYKSESWFSLYTLIEISSLLGIFHYRYELVKILFNTFSLIFNTIIFVPLMCIKLAFSLYNPSWQFY